MKATKVLPSNYHLHKTLDLSRPRVILWLNLAALPLLFIFGWLFGLMIFLLPSINPPPKGILNYLTSFPGWGLLAFPLLIIAIVSILLAWIVASTITPDLLFIATFNAAGSLGDMIVVAWVVKQPKTILVKDEGDIFSS